MEVHKGSEVVMMCRYDGLSRRRERVMKGETNRYVYHDPAVGGAGWLVVEVRDGANTVLETYTHGPDLSGSLGGAGGIGGILAVTHTGATNATYFYHYDANGNVVRLTDTNAAVVSTLDYTPFGRVLVSSGLYTPRHQFSTKEYDGAVGVNYYGYRFYKPELARWMRRDPMGEGNGDLNLYGFTGNAPVHRVDVDGRLSRSSSSQTDLFLAYFKGLGAQVQVTLHGTCCDGDVKYEYVTVELCFGIGLGQWGGGVSSPIYGEPWGNAPCPPDAVRFYYKVIGAATANLPNEPGVIVIGEIGDEGTEVGVGFGLGAGGAVVGCVAITRSSEAGCCEK